MKVLRYKTTSVNVSPTVCPLIFWDELRDISRMKIYSSVSVAVVIVYFIGVAHSINISDYESHQSLPTRNPGIEKYIIDLARSGYLSSASALFLEYFYIILRIFFSR